VIIKTTGTQNMTAAFAKHIEAIRSDAVTKTTVIGLRKTLNADQRRASGWSVGRTTPAVDTDTVQQAIDMIETKQPLVVGALHDTGVAVLTNKRYRKQLHPYHDVIDNLVSFHLIGFEPIGRRGEQVTPIYRATGKFGTSFTFINIPWQSGGNGPEVVYR
jgi:hypothetical protein